MAASLQWLAASPGVIQFSGRWSRSLLLYLVAFDCIYIAVEVKCLVGTFIASFIKNLHIEKIKPDWESNELFCNLMEWCDLPWDLVQGVLCANLMLSTKRTSGTPTSLGCLGHHWNCMAIININRTREMEDQMLPGGLQCSGWEAVLANTVTGEQLCLLQILV